MDEFRQRVEDFLEKHDMAPTTFGMRAAGDPRLVATLRKGRAPRVTTIERLDAWMEANSRRSVKDGADAGTGN